MKAQHPLSVFPKGFFNDICARKMSVFTWVELAGSLEVDGVEMYPNFFESFDAAHIKKVRQHATDRGLVIPMMCNSPDFTQPDPAARKAEVEKTRHMMNITGDMGGKFCRVLSGQNRPGLNPDEALKWVIDCIWQLVPHAESTGITMAIENHYKDGLWEFPEFAQSSKRYLAILDGVKSPWLKAQYDPSNAIVAGEDQYGLLEKIIPRMSTMQASDRYLEGGSINELKKMSADPQHGYAKFIKHGIIGRGLNDYDRIFSMLAKANYQGWVSIEDGEGPTIEEGMYNLRESVKFLRSKLAQYFPVK